MLCLFSPAAAFECLKPIRDSEVRAQNCSKKVLLFQKTVELLFFL